MNITIEPYGVVQSRAAITRVSPLSRKHCIDAMPEIGITLQNYMMREQLSGQALNVRTGDGRRSIFFRTFNNGSGIGVFVGADLTVAPYMRIQEYGGTIVPKNGKFLTIPIGEALTAKGVARFTARELISNPEAHGFTGTFFAKGMLFGTREGGEIVPLFLLRQRVNIKPAGYQLATMKNNAEWVYKRLGVVLDKVEANFATDEDGGAAGVQ